MTTEERKLALEAALLLGFQTEAAAFPVAGVKGEIPAPKTEEELQALYQLSEPEVPDGYKTAEGHPEPMFDLDFRKEKDWKQYLEKDRF